MQQTSPLKLSLREITLESFFHIKYKIRKDIHSVANNIKVLDDFSDIHAWIKKKISGGGGRRMIVFAKVGGRVEAHL